MDSGNVGMATALFGFLAVGAVALFSMIAVTTWSEARRKEREAYYKADMLKKLAEAPAPGAGAALELMREEARLGAERTRQGLRIGGLITGAAGLGVLIFLRVLLGGDEGVYLCGLIPLFVGIALYASSFLVTTAV
jgi:ferric-dicitrate binding protein FerR (iron transport regulator)